MVPPNQAEMMFHAVKRKDCPWPTWPLKANNMGSVKLRISNGSWTQNYISIQKFSHLNLPIRLNLFLSPISNNPSKFNRVFLHRILPEIYWLAITLPRMDSSRNRYQQNSNFFELTPSLTYLNPKFLVPSLFFKLFPTLVVSRTAGTSTSLRNLNIFALHSIWNLYTGYDENVLATKFRIDSILAFSFI